MTAVLIVAAWIAVSVLVAAAFGLGGAIGYRRGWEDASDEAEAAEPAAASRQLT